MKSVFARFEDELIAVFSLIALWPVLIWYAQRMLDGSDESFGLLALLTAILFAIFRRGRNVPTKCSMTQVFLLMLVYVASIFVLPAILRAAIAMTVIAVLLSNRFYGRNLHLGLWGLLLLSLPVMASIQFYLGYPLRLVVGFIAAFLLQLNGLAVTQSGTLLNWSGVSVSVDAPCSGIKMLWFGFYLCFSFACLYRFENRRLVMLAVMTALVIIAANALRATALFYIESGLLVMPPWSHNAVGIILYLSAAISIVYFGNRLTGGFHSCRA